MRVVHTILRASPRHRIDRRPAEPETSGGPSSSRVTMRRITPRSRFHVPHISVSEHADVSHPLRLDRCAIGNPFSRGSAAKRGSPRAMHGRPSRPKNGGIEAQVAVLTQRTGARVNGFSPSLFLPLSSQLSRFSSLRSPRLQLPEHSLAAVVSSRPAFGWKGGRSRIFGTVVAAYSCVWYAYGSGR